MTINRKHFDPSQTTAMKQALERAWITACFRYQPEAEAGARVRDMLAASILAQASKGERDPRILSEAALRMLRQSSPFYLSRGP